MATGIHVYGEDWNEIKNEYNIINDRMKLNEYFILFI